jgi:hypothetical protein
LWGLPGAPRHFLARTGNRRQDVQDGVTAGARGSRLGDQSSIDSKTEKVMSTVEQVQELFGRLTCRLDRIEATLQILAQKGTVKDWYTTGEVAALVGKAEFTVREWCRHGRIRAQKQRSGRGKYPCWVVSHDELTRYQRDGLLPIGRP